MGIILRQKVLKNSTQKKQLETLKGNTENGATVSDFMWLNSRWEVDDGTGKPNCAR